MKLDKLGLISKYEVIRETDLGYMLKSPGDEDEFFLHRNETNFKKLYPGDIVDAFLYLDKQKRPALTLYLPSATLVKGALCDVVSVTSAGAFINIGISKDILMSSDDFGYEEMPKRGDKLPIKLRVKGENIYAKLLNKEEMLENNDGYRYAAKEKTCAYVYRITKDGINLVDEHYNIFFIHKNNLRGFHRLGEKIEFTITDVKENGNHFDYYGTMIKSKENMLEEDCEVILNYLKTHSKVMNYTEDTDPLVIEKVFHMSKNAFKRALGHLYKGEIITILEGKIVLRR